MVKSRDGRGASRVRRSEARQRPVFPPPQRNTSCKITRSLSHANVIMHADVIMDVGAALRDAREQRGLSLDQLSHGTKISVTILQAIEHNRIDRLPDGIYLRGFLRAYAREVGLNPEDTVRRYLAQFEPFTNVIEVATPGSDQTRAGHGPVGAGIDRDAAERQAARAPWRFGIVVLVISLVGSYSFVRWWTAAPSTAPPVPRSPAGAIEIAGSSSPAVALEAAAAGRLETATAGSLEPTQAVRPEGDLLHVDIRPQGLCWLEATVDGTRIVYRLMQPGEQQTIKVRDEVVLRVGDPAALTFSINGMEGRSLGRAGEAVTVHVTRQNYREFLHH
jgi:cytoskeleton protein RodZ